MHIKTLCLGALSFSEASGYDIKKRFEATFGHFQRASYGSIYPALQQLAEQGLVSWRPEPGEGHPDRKIYRLTDEGEAALRGELQESPAGEQLRSDFLVLMFFAHLLPTEVLEKKLDEMQTYYHQRLDCLHAILRENPPTVGMRFTLEQGIAAYSAKLDQLLESRERLLREHRHVPEEWPAICTGQQHSEEEA